jgi:uncharacterized protein YlxW (UPF0749 family)
MTVTTAESSVEQPAALPAASAPAAVAAPRRHDHGWVWQVTALSVAMGIMLALAVRTTDRNRNSTTPGTRLGVSSAFLARYKERNHRLQQEIVELRRELSEYVASISNESTTTEALKHEFEALKTRAGLSAVEGPGLKITVRDNVEGFSSGGADEFANFMVHDQDLNNILSELKGAGGEHFALSGVDTDSVQRVVVTTTARCVGPVAYVNGTPLSAPYHIFVIGPPKQLRAALERPDGYVRGIRQLDARKMIAVQEEARLELPAYSGALTPRYARPATENAAETKSAPKRRR